MTLRELIKDQYDYSLVRYVNNHTKVKIICPIHGVFEQTPDSHLQGAGCPRCGREHAAIANSRHRQSKSYILTQPPVHVA